MLLAFYRLCMGFQPVVPIGTIRKEKNPLNEWQLWLSIFLVPRIIRVFRISKKVTRKWETQFTKLPNSSYLELY